MSDHSQDLMPVVILAGGRATRLRPLTDEIPKALVDVAGHPFLWHQLELLKRHRARRVVLAVGYLGECIEQRFGDGAELGIELQYSYDGPVLLGTAGAAVCDGLYQVSGNALFRALAYIGFLLNLFNLAPLGFLDGGRIITVIGHSDDLNFHGRDARVQVLMDITERIGLERELRHRAMHDSLTELGNRDLFRDRLEHALAEIYQNLLEDGDLAAFEVHERFYEIGSPAGLRETIHFFRTKRLINSR